MKVELNKSGAKRTHDSANQVIDDAIAGEIELINVISSKSNLTRSINRHRSKVRESDVTNLNFTLN